MAKADNNAKNDRKKCEIFGTKLNNTSLNLHGSKVQTLLSFRFFPP